MRRVGPSEKHFSHLNP